jgi:hypothetical protein
MTVPSATTTRVSLTGERRGVSTVCVLVKHIRAGLQSAVMSDQRQVKAGQTVPCSQTLYRTIVTATTLWVPRPLRWSLVVLRRLPWPPRPPDLSPHLWLW